MTDPPDLGILIADRVLVVRSWNRWLEQATGLSADAAVGRPLVELVPGLDARGFLARFAETLEAGAVHVLSPTFHRYLIPCSLRSPSPFFAEMQQRVHVGPLMDGANIEGIIVTIADVTPQLDAERRLAARMESSDPDERRAAAEEVGALNAEASLDSFTPALDAEDWRIRRTAVRTLAETADRELLQSLVEMLRRQHRSFSTLSSALKVLSMSDVPMTAPLVELLSDPDDDLRIQAALALGEQQDSAAIEPLMRALDDSHPNVRFHVIEALGRLRATDAVDVLADIVESDDLYLAYAAIDALALINDRRVAPRLAPLLANPELRDAVAGALGMLGDDAAVVPLVETLNAHPDATEAVAIALAAIERRDSRELGDSSHVAEAVRAHVSPDGQKHLIDAVERASPEALAALTRVVGWIPSDRAAATLVQLLSHAPVRDLAIDALEMRGEAVVELLRAALDDDDPAVVLAAVTGLGRIGSRHATSALVRLLDERSEVAVAAAGALARIGDPDAFEPLLAHAGHPHVAVRQAVVGALNAIGHAAMPDRIAALIESGDPFLRESAVRIAGYFGYDSTVDALLMRGEDPEEAIRAAAVEHLPFIDDPRVFEAVQKGLGDSSPKVRAAAARALARIEDHGAHDALLWALRDADLWVRYYAARALGERGDRSAVPALVTSASTDTAPHVRIAAFDALGLIGDLGAVPALLECAGHEDEDVAAAALRALGTLGAAEALTPLQGRARAPSLKIRLSAVAGLGALGTEAAVAALVWVASVDTDAPVFESAVSALADVATSSREGAGLAVASLLEMQADPRLAEAASAALSSLGAGRIGDIAHGLRHPQAEIRRKTIDTLARMRTATATEFLSHALDDEVSAVRETAVLALTRLGARRLEGRLRELAGNDPSKAVRRAAADAAARLRRG